LVAWNGRTDVDPSRLRTRISWTLAVLGLALLTGLACRVSWPEVLTSIRSLSKPWLMAMFTLTTLSVTLRAIRLSLLVGTHASFTQTWRSVCLGYFGSLFLPLGGGEVVKVAALRYESGVSLSRAGTALAMDRLFDVCALLALMAGVAGWGPHLRFRTGPLILLAAAAAAILALLAFLLVSGESLKERLARWTAGNPGRHPWIHRFDEVHGQARRLRKPGLLLVLVVLQACIFATDVVGAACGLAAFPFGRSLPTSAPVRLALFVMIGFGLPLLPGGFGSHQAASILALAPYGVGTAQALALSLAGEAVHVLTLSGLGLAAIYGSGMNPLRLFRGAEVVDSPHPPEVS
jgi:uncharacterized protein (TIRG00374 family)